MPGPEPQEETAAELRWRAPLLDAELSRLHAAAFGGPVESTPWSERLERHSLGWVTAHGPGGLLGFCNLVGDGGRHAFLVDLAVDPAQQGRGIGARILDEAIRRCRQDPRTQWLHVDFEEHLEGFYRAPGRFRPTKAGVLPV